MRKQVFLELTKEENLKKLNIDPRLVDSFKRVMIKIQQYFDSHGYSEKVDFETIINDYLLPREVVDREAIRRSTEFIRELNAAKEKQKQLEEIVTITINPLEEDEFLDEYIKKNYAVGLSIKVDSKEKFVAHAGIYKNTVNAIEIRESVLSSTWLDNVLCHEFIHFLTICGQEKFGSVKQTMMCAIYEPLTEMLASDVFGINPTSYENYCDFMKYVNLLCGVDGFECFVQRKLDPKYEEMKAVFENAQEIYDKHGYSILYGTMEVDELNYLVFSATSQLLFRDYESVEDLTDNLVNIYSAPQLFTNLEALESLLNDIVDMYLLENNITNPNVKINIIQLIKIKNERRLLKGINGIEINIENENYVLDENGNLYLKRLNELFKLTPSGTLISYTVDNGVLNLYTETGTYKCDLKGVDFKALENNLTLQQEMLERQIDTIMKKETKSRPYINSDTVSTDIARDTGSKVEVLEPVQSELKLRRPYIKKETMPLLQGRIKKAELELKKKQLLAQKEIVQKSIVNEQTMTMSDIGVVEEKQNTGLTL